MAVKEELATHMDKSQSLIMNKRSQMSQNTDCKFLFIQIPTPGKIKPYCLRVYNQVTALKSKQGNK